MFKRFAGVLLFILVQLNSFGQNSCNETQFLKDTLIEVSSTGNITWYKFRAKGGLLKLDAHFKNSTDLLQYEIIKDTVCDLLENNGVTAERIVKKGIIALTNEIWQLNIDSGFCTCHTCLQKRDYNRSNYLKLNQTHLYLIKVYSNKSPFKLHFHYADIKDIKPKFDIKTTPSELLEEGMVYKLKTIRFVPASANYMESSLPELEELARFLKTHEAVNIEVRGHVNGPLNSKPSFYQQLSDQRAAKIRLFLIEKGVKGNRIQTKGMSNFQMLFPSPKTEWEAEQNRRVEIYITAIKNKK